MEKLAASIVDTLSGEHYIKAVVGIGTPIANVKDLATSFKEAQIAAGVSKVFDTEKQMSHDNLGIAVLSASPTTVRIFCAKCSSRAASGLDQETCSPSGASSGNLDVSRDQPRPVRPTATRWCIVWKRSKS